MSDDNRSAESIERPNPPQATRLNKLAVVVAAAVMSLTLLTVAFMVGSEDSAGRRAEPERRPQPTRRAARMESFMDRPPSKVQDAEDPFTGLREAGGEGTSVAPTDGQGTASGGLYAAGNVPPPMPESYNSYYDDPPQRRGGGRTGSGPSEKEQVLQRALRSGLTPQGGGLSAGRLSGGSPAAAAYEANQLGAEASDYDDGYLETLGEIKKMFPGMNGQGAPPFAQRARSQRTGVTASTYGSSRAFLKEAAASRQSSNYITQTVQQPLSPFDIREGTLIEAYLLTGIHSDLPGEVIAQVARNVYDSHTQQALLIPKGTRLVGTYDNQIALDQSRLLVAWTRMIFPDGRSINLPGLASKDPTGASGLAGSVNRHYLRAFGNAMMLAVVGGSLSYGMQSQRQPGAYGYPTPGEVMAGSVATELSRVATEVLRGSVMRRPTIRIREGTPFNVFVNGDLALAPYRPQDGFMGQPRPMRGHEASHRILAGRETPTGDPAPLDEGERAAMSGLTY